MRFLTKKVTRTINILVYIRSNPKCTKSQISKATGIIIEEVTKISKNLKEKDLIDGYIGRGGCLIILKPLSQISFKDIYDLYPPERQQYQERHEINCPELEALEKFLLNKLSRTSLNEIVE